MCARPTLEKAFGSRSLMGTSLRRLEKSLAAHEPLSTSAVELCRRLDYIELLPVMHALSITRVVGTGVISILRNSCQMLSELIAVRSEVEANNAGKNAEAVLLCLMPFGITFALSSFTGDYMAPAQSKPLGVMLMLLAFCIAVISCAFLFGLIGEKNTKSGMPIVNQSSFSKLSRLASARLRKIAASTLPQSYLTRQYEIFSELSYKPDEMFEAMLLKIVVTTLVTTPLCIFVLFSLHYSLLLAIPILLFLLFLIHHDVRSQAQRRKETIMDEIPLFLSMLVTLMQSGVLLPKAIETCSAAFPDSGIMGGELRIINAQMLSGISAGEAIENFSSRTSIPEAQSALLLASRYESTGGAEVLGLLALQANACWSLCRNASRKKREREAVAMILPMMLDFISVLLVAVTPALISLQLS
jgi:Flp pilus assembly protein TadB